MTAPSIMHDLVVIGASSGGIPALKQLLGRLPRDLPATVLVVQHLAPTSPRHLVAMLQQDAAIPVKWAEDGDPLRHARAYVAPPSVHLLVDHDRVALSKAARENHARPSINRLFRSAAAHAGSRVIGVLLSGTMDDGVAGLAAIRWVGGVTFVQHPAEAEYPDLPQNALANVDIDRVADVETLALAIVEQTRTPASISEIPREVTLHAELDRAAQSAPADLDALGPSGASCPTCGEPIWKVAVGNTATCCLGLAVSPRDIVRDDAIEGILWTAIRALEDRSHAYATMAESARDRRDLERADRDEDHAACARDQARRLADILVEIQKS